jgi:hypothetical protein
MHVCVWPNFGLVIWNRMRTQTPTRAQTVADSATH